MSEEPRIDPHLGTRVHVVAARQNRPNLPVDGCPFCPGGLEAPAPYDTRAFPNRWPALGPGRCEVILYSPDHDQSLSGLGDLGVRRVVDLWTERTQALRALPGVETVLVFENRGAEVGATIAHPHGQIYAFDHVPERIARLLASPWCPDTDPGERGVTMNDTWTAWTPHAPVHPVSIVLAPLTPRPDLASLDDGERDDLARLLVDVLGRMDRLFDRPLPYMMWIVQAPTSAPDAWMHVEIVSPWRAEGVPRFIAAAEVATGEYFNPVDPADVARRLRDVAP